MKMDSAKINFTADIMQGGYLSITDNEVDRIERFLQDNDGKEIDVTYIATDGVRYWQHKYYRAYVLPDIAEGMGEKDLYYLHEFVLKQQFLFFPVSDYRDIPRRHHKGIRIIMNGDQMIGYVPSMGSVNFQEGKEFIIQCEALRDGLIDWSHHESDLKYIKEYHETRAKAMKEVKHEKFDSEALRAG